MRLIQNGITGTAMAALPNMTEPNAQTIVAYLRSMASTAAAVAALPPGDARRGKTLFEGKGACTSCHRVGDAGSRAGPNRLVFGLKLSGPLISARTTMVTAWEFRKIR